MRGCSLSQLQYNIENHRHCNKAGKRSKGHTDWKERMKTASIQI